MSGKLLAHALVHWMLCGAGLPSTLALLTSSDNESPNSKACCSLLGYGAQRRDHGGLKRVLHAVRLSHLKLVLKLTDQAVSPVLALLFRSFGWQASLCCWGPKAFLTALNIQPYRLIALSLLLKILSVIVIVSNNVMIYICL